jgi:MFS family permease
MTTTTVRPARYPALRHRNFTMLWSGLIVSNMGTWMQNVAQSWLIYKLTGNNPLFLGYLGLSFALPMTLLPPFGGAIVDRVDRVKLLYITQTGMLLVALIMAVLAWTDRVQPWHILTASFIQALCLAFDNPSRQSLIPELVPRVDLLNALSLNSATYNGAALVGPAIAGILLTLVGPGWLYMVNAISYLAVIGALVSMRGLPQRQRSTTSLREAILGGWLFIWRHKLILGLLGLSALASLFGRAYTQLLPVFADDIWRVGSPGYGQLLAAAGGGALLGAFVMSSLPNLRSHGRVMVGAGLVFCLSLALFAICPWYWVGVALLVVVGMSSTIFGTMIATTVQLRTPNEMRGRVMSFYAATIIGLPALGALGIAAVATELGRATPNAFAAIGLAVLNVFGVASATAGLDDVSGAPRAIVLGALILGLILLVAAPRLVGIRVPGSEGK